MMELRQLGVVVDPCRPTASQFQGPRLGASNDERLPTREG